MLWRKLKISDTKQIKNSKNIGILGLFKIKSSGYPNNCFREDVSYKFSANEFRRNDKIRISLFYHPNKTMAIMIINVC